MSISHSSKWHTVPDVSLADAPCDQASLITFEWKIVSEHILGPTDLLLQIHIFIFDSYYKFGVFVIAMLHMHMLELLGPDGVRRKKERHIGPARG
jgi:hypothetical protein